MIYLSDITLVKSLLNNATFSPLNEVKATQLIERYASIEGILFASSDELETTYGLTSEQIALARLIRTVLLRSQEEKLYGIGSIEQKTYIEYIKLHIAHRAIEGLFVILFSSQKKYIHSDLINTGSEDAAILPINSLVKIALNHNAHYIVLAHNHPSGNTKPSQHDISLTHDLRQTLLRLNIFLIDHVIVSPMSTFSILSNKVITHLSDSETIT